MVDKIRKKKVGNNSNEIIDYSLAIFFASYFSIL